MSAANSTSMLPVSEETIASWQSHLDELRWRLTWCAGVLVVTTLLGFCYAPQMIQLFQVLAPKNTVFIQTNPGEVFFVSMRLALYAGVGFSLPVLLYHLIKFVMPGLRPQEARLLIPFMMLAVVFFAIGLVCGYLTVLPLMLVFFADYGSQVAKNMWSIEQYLSMCSGFVLACGLLFELPIAVLLCNRLGLLNAQTLISWWRWAIVVSVVLGGIVTPSVDPISQLVMAAVLMALYGASILLVASMGRKPTANVGTAA